MKNQKFIFLYDRISLNSFLLNDHQKVYDSSIINFSWLSIWGFQYYILSESNIRVFKSQLGSITLSFARYCQLFFQQIMRVFVDWKSRVIIKVKTQTLHLLIVKNWDLASVLKKLALKIPKRLLKIWHASEVPELYYL